MTETENNDDLSFIVASENDGERLDKYLAEICLDVEGPHLSRSRLKALILDEKVTVNARITTNPSTKVGYGSKISVHVPPPVDATPQPEDIPLDIVYEDDQLLVINKSVGLVVHPGAGNWTGTLVNALLHYCGDSLSGIGGVKRPGIVHRLDKDTSGLMLVAKTDAAHQGLAAQLADRSLSRRYLAFVWKAPRLKRGKVDQPIGRHPSNRLKMTVNQRNGRSAVTHYEVKEIFKNGAASLIECRLESGRTHQIRVHMLHLGYPLIGDKLYGIQLTAARSQLKKGDYEAEAVESIMNFPRQALHAWKISFIHPLTKEEMTFEAPLPDDLKVLDQTIRG